MHKRAARAASSQPSTKKFSCPEGKLLVAVRFCMYAPFVFVCEKEDDATTTTTTTTAADGLFWEAEGFNPSSDWLHRPLTNGP
jgi:hypothetical protein